MLRRDTRSPDGGERDTGDGTAGDDEVRQSLDKIDREMIRLFALVGEGMAGATDSFLASDRVARAAALLVPQVNARPFNSPARPGAATESPATSTSSAGSR